MSMRVSKNPREVLKNNPEKLQELKEVFESLGSKHDKPLSKITVSNYVSKLNKLSSMVLGHPYDGRNEWLLDAQKVISVIRKSDISGKKDMFSPVVRLLKKMDAGSDVVGEYQKAMSEFKDGEYKVRKENKAKEDDMDNALPLGEIKDRIKLYKPKDTLELIYKLIVSFYFSNTLVPRNDLNIVKFVSDKKKAKDMNPEFNYIVLDKNKSPVEMVWNNYKSRNTYGRQKFPITAEVKTLLKEYIRSFDKQNGDLLFAMRDGEPFKKSNFLDLIRQAMEAVIGKPIGVDLARKIQISQYYNEHAKSIDEDEKDAMRYLHSPQIHKEYLKVNLPKDDADDE